MLSNYSVGLPFDLVRAIGNEWAFSGTHTRYAKRYERLFFLVGSSSGWTGNFTERYWRRWIFIIVGFSRRDVLVCEAR